MLRIKEICKSKGITTIQLANEIGMLQPSLSRIINGGNTTVETLQRIANALDVSMGELFTPNHFSDFAAMVNNRGELKYFNSVNDLKNYLETLE